MDPNSLVKRRRCLTREEEAEILMKKASGKFADKELAEQHGVCLVGGQRSQPVSQVVHSITNNLNEQGSPRQGWLPEHLGLNVFAVTKFMRHAIEA